MSSQAEKEFYGDSVSSPSFYWPYFFQQMGGNASDSSYEYLLSEVVIKVTSDYHKWIMTISACILVGLSGIFPLLLFSKKSSFETNKSDGSQKDEESLGGIDGKQLKRLLNFAVGSLLGDVFLHLLPEAWNEARESGASQADTLTFLGFWVLIGIVSFVICEKLVSYGEEEGEEDVLINDDDTNDSCNNNNTKEKICQKISEKEANNKQIAGYLNLVANGFDNFTHGLAVAGSFIISSRIGFLTTAAILLHEIPHEIADFAILLRAGFNPWSAAKAQLSTASVGLLGAIITLSADSMQSMGNLTWWILPFTSGCFINIALTNLLPDLVKEEDPKESAKQFGSIILGIGVMAFVSTFHEG